MMLLLDKKKSVSAILNGIKTMHVQKLGEKDSPDFKKEEVASGAESAAASLLQAIDEGNPKAMAKALKDFIYLCEE